MHFLQRERLPHHSNGMRFTAFDAAGETLDSAVSYSVGGGAVVDEADVARNAPPEGRVGRAPSLQLRATSSSPSPRTRA